MRQRLLAELAHPAAVKQALGTSGHHGRRQHTDQQHAHHTADEVHADDVEGVVVVEPELQPDGERAHHTRGEADESGAEGAHGAARRGDGHQAGDDAGSRTEGGRLSVPDLLDRQPAEHAQASRDQRVEKYRRCQYHWRPEPNRR